MPSGEINNFMKNFYEHYNNSLGLSEEQKEESRQRAKNDGFFGKEKKERDFTEIAETSLAFFNVKSGLELAFNLNSAFPLPGNPYFNVFESGESFYNMLESTQISTELVMFCVEHCKHELPFFKEENGQRDLENIDFLLRFWKKEFYHTKAGLTVVGKK